MLRGQEMRLIIDSLYLQAKQIAFDYNDQKREKLILVVIETFFRLIYTLIWFYV
jgi:hypothetical protein